MVAVCPGDCGSPVLPWEVRPWRTLSGRMAQWGSPIVPGRWAEAGRPDRMAARTEVRSCGDVWIRQGLAPGEREPRMLLRPRKSGSKTKYLATASRLSPSLRKQLV